MSNYFSFFPSIEYNFDALDQDSALSKNIMLRFVAKSKIKEKNVVYYTYSIQDGDRPDIIASKYYGNPNYDWIIMVTNDIFDVNYDWPLDYLNFRSFLEDKYGSVPDAKAKVHRYERILKKAEPDSFGNDGDERVIIVDETTYNNLALNERRRVTAYDYEVELNESKRNILILDRQYIEQIINEADEIFNT